MNDNRVHLKPQVTFILFSFSYFSKFFTESMCHHYHHTAPCTARAEWPLPSTQHQHQATMAQSMPPQWDNNNAGDRHG